METINPDIEEALGLAPDEADKLFDLLAKHQMSMSEVFEGVADGNYSVSAQERTAALNQLQQANEAELQAMLGSKYLQWQDYTQTRPVWQQRRDLRAVLEAAGTPMTKTQGKALIAALSTEQRNFNQETRGAARHSRSFAEVLPQTTPERRQRLLAASAPHLSPQQFEAYRGMLERQAAQVQSILAPTRTRDGEAATVAPP